MKNNMLNRFATSAAFLLVSLPLIACGSKGDDDSTNNTSTWAGHTYLLSLDKGDWAVPRGVGMDLFGVAPAFMFDVEGTGTDLTVTLGYGAGTVTDSMMNTTAVTVDNAKQDSCGLTTTTTFSAANSPHSTISIPQTNMHVVNAGAMPGPLQVTAPVYNLEFTDILPDGSTPSKTGKLTATMNLGQLAVLFQALGPDRNAQAVCDAFSSAYTPKSCMTDSCKVTCQPCPNAMPGDAPTCLSVEADPRVGAVQADNIKVNPITSVDPTACADSTIQ